MNAQFFSFKKPHGAIPCYTWDVPQPEAVLILIHGLKSHAGWSLETGAEFALRKIKVYAFDRMGSGRSEFLRGHIEDYRIWLEDIRFILQLAKKENPGCPLHLLGHCFGARLAMAFAAAYPQEAETLTLIAPPLFSLKAGLTLLEKLKVACALLLGRQCRVRVPIRDGMFTSNPEKDRFIREDPLKLEMMTSDFCREILRIDGHIRKNLSKIRIPTLVLLAYGDEVVDNERIAKRLFANLKCRRKALEIFDCRHYLFFESLREKVIEKIADWIKPGKIQGIKS